MNPIPSKTITVSQAQADSLLGKYSYESWRSHKVKLFPKGSVLYYWEHQEASVIKNAFRKHMQYVFTNDIRKAEYVIVEQPTLFAINKSYRISPDKVFRASLYLAQANARQLRYLPKYKNLIPIQESAFQQYCTNNMNVKVELKLYAGLQSVDDLIYLLENQDKVYSFENLVKLQSNWEYRQRPKISKQESVNLLQLLHSQQEENFKLGMDMASVLDCSSIAYELAVILTKRIAINRDARTFFIRVFNPNRMWRELRSLVYVKYPRTNMHSVNTFCNTLAKAGIAFTPAQIFRDFVACNMHVFKDCQITNNDYGLGL